MRTIAAISTPPGEGGIGIVRISGADAQKIADRVFHSVSGKKIESLPGYTSFLGLFLMEKKHLINALPPIFGHQKAIQAKT